MLLLLAACAPAPFEPASTVEPPEIPLRESDAAAGPFESDLGARLRGLPGDEWETVLIDLTEQVDVFALGARLRADGLPKRARRAAVIDALETVASRQQAKLGAAIEAMQAEGRIGFVRPVAIVNRLVVEGTASAILELADRPEIAIVRAEWSSARRPGTGSTAGRAVRSGRSLGESFRNWAVDALGADELWARGLDGRGIVVGVIDTGVDGTHEQLSGRYLEGERGWFDPVEGRSAPYDSHGHGTSVLSLAVGGNPDGRVLGIAPGASWVAALGNARNTYSRVRMTLAADWMLRTARPDVLVNAWSDDQETCVAFDLDFINAWRAAEIFVVFPAGNSGPGPATGEAPAQLPGVYPDGGAVFSVAGLARDGTAHPESSRGPSLCGSDAFPFLSAPGADLPFAFPGGSDAYGVGDGTSLAAGVVAGAVALLLQADPERAPDDLERVLGATARDVPPTGRDDVTGAGALDLPAALRALEETPTGAEDSP